MLIPILKFLAFILQPLENTFRHRDKAIRMNELTNRDNLKLPSIVHADRTEVAMCRNNQHTRLELALAVLYPLAEFVYGHRKFP